MFLIMNVKKIFNTVISFIPFGQPNLNRTSKAKYYIERFIWKILPYAEVHVYWRKQPQIKINKNSILYSHYKSVSLCLME